MFSANRGIPLGAAPRFELLAMIATLQAAGENYSEAANPIDPFLVEGRELITGKNPNSSMAVGKALLALMK
jgi:putative intracellular protease/amidase